MSDNATIEHIRHNTITITSALQKITDAADIPEAILFGANHVNYDVPRGQFKRSRDWFAAELQLHIIEADEPDMQDSDSDSDSDSDDDPDKSLLPEAFKSRAQCLRNLLSTIFPERSEEFVLHHGDLNPNNILIDADHNISGVLDWECIYAVPLWVACEIPKFLGTDYERNEVPDYDSYFKETDEQTGEEIVNEMYLEHMEEYEKTQLRKFFLEAMQRICPEWVQVYQSNRLKSAFAEVVSMFSDVLSSRTIEKWIAQVEKTGGYCHSIVSVHRDDCSFD